MNKIVDVARNKKEVMSGAPVTCVCGEQWFSPFDKLYLATYGKCVSCSTSEEIEKNSGNIFAIIEAYWRTHYDKKTLKR